MMARRIDGKTIATVGMVLGILSFPSAAILLIGLLLSSSGIVCSLLGMKHSRGVGIAGLFLSIVGMIFAICWARFVDVIQPALEATSV